MNWSNAFRSTGEVMTEFALTLSAVSIGLVLLAVQEISRLRKELDRQASFMEYWLRSLEQRKQDKPSDDDPFDILEGSDAYQE